MITPEEVHYIAGLARLRLSQSEIETLSGQLGSILGYVELLSEVDTSSVEPTCLVAPAHDQLREDDPAPSLPPGKVLQNGPNTKKGFFAVPKVIG